MTSADTRSLLDVPVILLDLDGTIVDSGPGILASFEHAFTECGVALPPPAVLRTFLGPPLEESFRDVLGLSEVRSEQLRRAYGAHYRAHGLRTATAYAGIAEMVRTLTGSGRRVAVATNKRETTAQHLLDHLDLSDLFDLVGGTDPDVGRSGKAAVIGSVLDRLGVPSPPEGSEGPPRAVMVGDRLHDADGAAAHGLPAVLVGWGYGGAPEREADLPRADTVSDLTRMLLP